MLGLYNMQPNLYPNRVLLMEKDHFLFQEKKGIGYRNRQKEESEKNLKRKIKNFQVKMREKRKSSARF